MLYVLFIVLSLAVVYLLYTVNVLQNAMLILQEAMLTVQNNYSILDDRVLDYLEKQNNRKENN